MTEIFKNIFEIARPFMLVISPFLLLGLIGSFLKILYPDYRYGFFKPSSNMKKRRRRKAYWRLLKYKIASRRKCKHDKRKSSEFAEGSYLWNFTYKDKR